MAEIEANNTLKKKLKKCQRKTVKFMEYTWKILHPELQVEKTNLYALTDKRLNLLFRLSKQVLVVT